MSKKSDHLIDDSELLIVQTKLAVRVGDRQAIALQQIHYWAGINQKADKQTHFIDGMWWAYNTWREWHDKNFPFWSIATIRRVFRDLESAGLITSRPHKERNKGAWVTVNYGQLETLFQQPNAPRVKRPKTSARSDQNEQGGLIKMSRPSDQNEQTTSDTENTENTPESHSRITKIPKRKTKRVEAAPTPVSKKVYEDVPKDTRRWLINAWCSNLLAQPIGAFKADKNHETAADLHRAGITEDMVADFVREKQQDTYWKDKTLTFQKVAELLPEWKARKEQTTPNNGVWSQPLTAAPAPVTTLDSEARKRLVMEGRATRQQLLRESAGIAS